MNPMNAWLIIGLAVVALWILWAVLDLIAGLMERWYAAHRREDLSTTREREQS